MPKYIEKIEKYTLPVIAVRGSVAFPSVSLSFELCDESSVNAAAAAFENDSPVLICALKELDGESLTQDDFFMFFSIRDWM